MDNIPYLKSADSSLQAINRIHGIDFVSQHGMELLQFTDSGLYCPPADVYLDPWKPVHKALISHAHSDHATGGCNYYLCTDITKPLIQYRLNLADDKVESTQYGTVINIHGVQFSFHPAGHIPGSAQIRIEYKGEVWCFSGDYKLQVDGISTPFEPVRCDVFVTESTFGLPVFRWDPPQKVFDEINNWWNTNRDEGKISILAGYALGKAQRIVKHLNTSIGKIYVHGAVQAINGILHQQNIKLPETTYVSPEITKQDLEGALVICPPSALGSPWMRRFLPYSSGIASGWMNLRGARRRRSVDRGFVLSDHADWNELNDVIAATGAERIFVTHGYSETFAQWLREKGLQAHEVKTQYEGELAEIAEGSLPNEIANDSTV